MSLERWSFPFTGIVGQEQMKQALLLNAINPAIGGVLIRGDRGTAKSTAVRALASLLPEQTVVEACSFGCDPRDAESLCDDCLNRLEQAIELPTASRKMRVVELPVNASEDRVVGTIDLEAALTKGAKRFEPGVLGDANRNVLYVDEVNLLDDHIVDVLLDAAAMGTNVVEREGLSVVHPSRFILVGTMNPDEGDLRPQLLDRFGLCVDIRGIDDIDQRVAIADLRTRWDADPKAVHEEFAAPEAELRARVSKSMRRCSGVEMTKVMRRVIAYLSISLHVDGHRADLVLARAAQAVAAHNGADAVDSTHIAAVAEMVYAHRRSESADGTRISQLVTKAVSAEARQASEHRVAELPALRRIDI